MKFEISSVIRKEQEALTELDQLLNGDTERAVEMILSCTGKVVFVGIGKSGHIGEKLAATFSSTGTPAFFVHCAECFHGDFGMIQAKDLVILISNSGRTQEIVNCAPVIKSLGCKLIAITQNADSPLARIADCVLLLPKCGEADHLNLAPTVSSTATLVLGDALACAVSKRKGFTQKDFHRFHPGGDLGQKLTRVGD